MKKLLVSLAIAAALPGAVVAQQNVNERDDTVVRTTIQQPRNGTTVGRTFTLSGTMTPDCGVDVTIDNVLSYLAPDVRETTRNQRGGSELPPAGRSDSKGNYSVRIDLNGDAIGFVIGSNVEQDPPSKFLRGVQAGNHRFLVRPAFCNSNDNEGAVISLAVQDEPATTEATPTPSPSLTPTSRVVDEAPAVKASFWDKLPSWAWLLIGALIGAMLLGLAEYTAYRHRKKHPRSLARK